MEDVRRKREELYDVRGKKEEGRVFAAALNDGRCKKEEGRIIRCKREEGRGKSFRCRAHGPTYSSNLYRRLKIYTFLLRS